MANFPVHGYGSGQIVQGFMDYRKRQKAQEQEIFQDLVNASKAGTLNDYDPAVLSKVREKNPGLISGLEVANRQVLSARESEARARKFKLADSMMNTANKFNNFEKYGAAGKQTTEKLTKQAFDIYRSVVPLPPYAELLEGQEKKKMLETSFYKKAAKDISIMQTGQGMPENKASFYEDHQLVMYELQKVMDAESFRVVEAQSKEAKKVADARLKAKTKAAADLKEVQTRMQTDLAETKLRTEADVEKARLRAASQGKPKDSMTDKQATEMLNEALGLGKYSEGAGKRDVAQRYMRNRRTMNPKDSANTILFEEELRENGSPPGWYRDPVTGDEVKWDGNKVTR